MNVVLNAMLAIAMTLTAAALMWMPVARGDPGDIVVTRQVSPRSAFREGTGPVSSKVNAAQQVKSGLGLNQSAGGTVGRELSDGEFANVVSGIPQHGGGVTAGQPNMSGVRTSGMASYGVSAGSTVTGLLAGGGGGGGGGGAGAVTRQATGQIVDALKGAGLIGR